MTDIQAQIEKSVTEALVVSYGPDFAGVNPAVRPAANRQFGDYQADLCMALGKRLRCSPREVAQRLADCLCDAAWADEVNVAGPGFINIRLRDEELLRAGRALTTDPRLGVEPVARPLRVVVDYSSPNVAKEMHVGHLRATIIGDSIARILTFQGHDVVRQNHIGDWGTQFGMLIQYMAESAETQHLGQSVQDLNAVYQTSKSRFDNDSEFAERARQRVVALQSGDVESLAVWQRLVAASQAYFTVVYDRLDVLLTAGDTRGESAYNSSLPEVVDELDRLGLLRSSDGAAVVYPEGAKDRDGNPMPMIVRKSDGGYLYATTDLAAARYRLRELHAERIIYVTDARQRDHFSMLFSVLRQTGWAGSAVQLEHVAFGSVLGKDRKPFKTRSGGIVRLVDLLDEAESRAKAIIGLKNPQMSTETMADTSHAIGVGALKYADLASDRIRDYVFDWDKLLAFDGNTAPYLQNAYVRIMAIFRKVGIDFGTMATDSAELLLTHTSERTVLLDLIRFPRIVRQVGESLEPHHLCGYLYDLATHYHQFYEQCPVLNAETPVIVQSRLSLSALTARVLKTGLDLLGISTVDRM